MSLDEFKAMNYMRYLKSIFTINKIRKRSHMTYWYVLGLVIEVAISLGGAVFG